MLPISIVEKEGFREYVNYLNPSFSIPTRHRIKETGLPALRTSVDLQLMLILLALKSINISVDGWTDPIFRCFFGYSAQGLYQYLIFKIIKKFLLAYFKKGITDDWRIVNITIAFEYMTGRHTALQL